MNQSEIQANQANAPEPALRIGEDARSFWPGARGWSLFLAVIGFIGAGMIGLLLLFMINLASKNEGFVAEAMSRAIIIYFVLFAAILIISILFLQISNSLSRAIRHGRADDVRHSSGKLLNYFRVVGVLAILAILFQSLSLIGWLSA